MRRRSSSLAPETSWPRPSCSTSREPRLEEPSRAPGRAIIQSSMPGAILFNGNAETDENLIRGAAPLLLSSRHKDPEVAASKRVLLITAGWAEDEHNEGHVKATLN